MKTPMAWFVLLCSAVSVSASPSAADEMDKLIQLDAEVRALDLDAMEDLSEQAFADRARAIEDLRARFRQINFEDWEIPQRVDFFLVASRIYDVLFEHATSRPWRRDPGFYVDRLSGIPYRELPVEGQELQDLRKRLASVAGVVAAAKTNLTEGAGDLTRLALRNLEKHDGVGHGQPYRATPPAGVIGWYGDFLERARRLQPELAGEAEAALTLVTQFRDWLREREPEMNAPSGVGLEQYNWRLRRVLLMPFDAGVAGTIGERELHRALTQLELERVRNRGLPPLEPASSAEEYQRRIAETDREIRDFIRRVDLLTIPGFIGEFGNNVPWISREGGNRNFWEEIQYRDPMPDHVHAVIPGHRFDAALHERDNRPIRGAFSDSGRVEGWGFYLEETMMNLGLLDKRPRTRELFHIFNAARAIRNRVEIGLHTNRLTVEQAVQVMVREIPYMDEDVARVDCEIYLRRPGYGISYLMGKVQIEKLLAERKQELGDKFNLREFHDQFLASGWVPVSMIRWEMTQRGDEVGRLLQ